MPLLVSLADLRDGFIIVYGILGIIFFFIASIVTVVIGFAVRALLRTVREMLDESVKPTMTSIKEAAETIRGTTDFVGKTTVAPIAKAYGMFAGVKKGAAVLAGLNRLKRSK